ncbi:Trypsin [Trichostrongylus colubriformis]|uniref:Trypsin n=1 Tax=Trichostrongylus colubriformis TaxID=6319 RepID=A0AAN8F039_TRICO
MQLILLLCLFLLSPNVFTRRLTNEENRRLKKTCGADRLKMGRHTLKSMHGEKVEINMFPWVAALFAEGACSAVQISSRHILTAAHCFRVRKDPKMVTKTLYAATPPEDITVYVSSSCVRPQFCPGRAKFTITQPPHMHEGYNPCTDENDLALIELDSDIPTEIGTPICMRENEKLAQKLTSVGYGFDPNHPDPKPLHWLQKVDFHSDDVQESDTRITASHRTKSTCMGDSGGPLVQLNHKNKYVLVGIVSGGIPECSETITEEQRNILPRESYFTNLRGHLDWICTHTGVCPIQQMGSHHDEGSFSKEHISIEIGVIEGKPKVTSK